jgi:ATP-dependent Clp protease ATP-binding subunit ClpA
VEEPSIEDTCEMLMGIKDYYENYHRVAVSESLIRRAVVLSERYINDRFLPDKAIDLLDEACTSANLRNKHISDLEQAETRLTELEEEHRRVTENVQTGEEESMYAEAARLKAEIPLLRATWMR